MERPGYSKPSQWLFGGVWKDRSLDRRVSFFKNPVTLPFTETRQGLQQSKSGGTLSSLKLQYSFVLLSSCNWVVWGSHCWIISAGRIGELKGGESDHGHLDFGLWMSSQGIEKL